MHKLSGDGGDCSPALFGEAEKIEGIGGQKKPGFVSGRRILTRSRTNQANASLKRGITCEGEENCQIGLKPILGLCEKSIPGGA